jgi:hypothetical protein
MGTKFQAPNNKQIPIAQIQNSKQDRFGHSKFGIDVYLGFGNWNLEF